MFLTIIDAWAARTETGDRAEIADLPEDLPLWNDVAASAENCLGGDCPRYDECFVTRMRQRAEESDVVIVNHHLLFADAALRRNAYGEVIPDCQHAVLDEAHQLEDVATQYFGVAVSTWGVEDLASDIERWAARALPQPAARTRCSTASSTCGATPGQFFTTLDASRTTREERVRLTARDRWTRRRDGRRRGRDARRPRGHAPAGAPAARRGRRARGAGGRQPRNCCRWHAAPGRLRDGPALPAARVGRRLRLLPRSARARRVPARGADRRVADGARDGARSARPPPC